MKDFKQVAAMQFISKSDNDKQEVEKRKEEFTIEKKAMRETKSRALSLLIKQSTYTALKTQSKNSGLSINEIANQLLEHYINKQTGMMG